MEAYLKTVYLQTIKSGDVRVINWGTRGTFIFIYNHHLKRKASLLNNLYITRQHRNREKLHKKLQTDLDGDLVIWVNNVRVIIL